MGIPTGGLLWAGRSSDLRIAGEPVPNENDLTTGPARLVPGYLDEQIFSGEALLSFLSMGGARVAIVLPLHLITERVERIFAEAD